MKILIDAPQDHRQTVENIGVFFEQQGFRPINARIFAYLLLADPRYKNLEEIQQYLRASKSSVSTSIKYLLASELLEQITFNGDRTKYYQVNMGGYLKRSKRRLQRLDAVNGVLTEVLNVRSHTSDPTFYHDLGAMIAFNEYITQSARNILENWEKQHPYTGAPRDFGT